MKPNKVLSAILVTLYVLLLAACSQPNQTTSKTDEINKQTTVAENQDQRLTEYLDSLFDRDVRQSPNYQSHLGVDFGDLDKWSDTSDVHTLKELAETKADLSTLQSNFDYELLSEDGKLSYDIAKALFQASIDEAKFYRQSYVTDQFVGQFMSPITLLQNNHSISSVQDAQNYIARLNGIEALKADMVSRLKDRAEFGVIAPAFSFLAMIGDIGSVLTGAPLDDSAEDHPLYADFKTKVAALDIEQPQKTDLIEKAAAALKGSFYKGYSSLLAETKRLQTLQNDSNGVWAIPDGEAFYNMRIKRFTTLNQSADEVHNIGLAEVERIHAEIQLIMDKIDFEGSLQAFFDFVRTDPNNFYSFDDAGRADFLKDAQADTDRIFAIADQYFHSLPKAEMEVRRVEPWRENSTSIAFYNSPSQDGTRPGIYYANLADMSAVQKYLFRSITFHEGVPGHHFQLARTQEFEGLPKMRKYRAQAVFTEGWALYAEQLAGEMGMSDEPLYAVGRLQSELWRAVRLVVDTGIHAKRWTPEQAIAYFADSTPLALQDIVTEVERFFVLPGQALSYKTGMITILELRQKARDALGDDFDIRDFHEAVLGAGSMPMPLLIKRVDAYIAAAQ